MLEWYELLPVIWLGFVCILDIWIGYGLKIFYCRTLKDLMIGHDPAIIPGHNPTACPICQELLPNGKQFHLFCSNHVGPGIDNLWLRFKHMSHRYQQLAFFEVISIQFFIGFIKSEYTTPLPYNLPLQLSQIVHVSQIDVSNFYLLVAILFMIVFYFIITIIKHDPCVLYVDKRIRLFFIICIFIFSLSF